MPTPDVQWVALNATLGGGAEVYSIWASALKSSMKDLRKPWISGKYPDQFLVERVQPTRALQRAVAFQTTGSSALPTSRVTDSYSVRVLEAAM